LVHHGDAAQVPGEHVHGEPVDEGVQAVRQCLWRCAPMESRELPSSQLRGYFPYPQHHHISMSVGESRPRATAMSVVVSTVAPPRSHPGRVVTLFIIGAMTEDEWGADGPGCYGSIGASPAGAADRAPVLAGCRRDVWPGHGRWCGTACQHGTQVITPLRRRRHPANAGPCRERWQALRSASPSIA
jgi:hypothetical protein